MFKEALAEFYVAKEYSTKLQNEDPKKAQFVYEIDFGIVNMLTEVDKTRLPEALHEFMEKYPVMTEEMDMIKRQNVGILFGHCLFKLKKYDEARGYLTLSSNLLEQLISQLQPSAKTFKKKQHDYEVRKSQICYTVTKIALAEKKFNEAKEACEKALQCKGVEKDVEVYFYFLKVKRMFLPPKERLEVSLKMHSLWTKNRKRKLKKKGLKTLYYLFQDYLAREDYENAEHQLWLAHKEKEAAKKDGEENCVLEDLNEWYRLRKRLEAVAQLNVEDLKNNFDLHQKYERAAFGLFKLKAFEVGYQYYEKLLQIIKAIFSRATSDDDMKKKKSILELLIKCLNGFAKSQDDYSKCFQHFDQLYDISKSLMTPDLNEILLDRVFALTKLDICSFEEKKNALIEVKYYTTFITLIKDNQDAEIGEDIQEMNEQLQLYQSRIQDSATEFGDNIVSTSTCTDEFDEILDAEIFKALQEKWNKYEKDPSGRTPLMEAASLRNAALIRLLLINDANPLLKDAIGKMASWYLQDKIKLCNAALKNRGVPKINVKEKKEIAKYITKAEFDDLKEAMKLLKNAEEEREKRDKENDQKEDVKYIIKAENDEDVKGSNPRKRLSDEVSNISKRTKSN
uniref:Uncharacterized protein n=1 Tax=Panagrolaimus sp. ES5 TaxID=591445 RepID=A0AC34GQF8_9BILA